MSHRLMRGIVGALATVFVTSALTLAADTSKPAAGAAETPKAAQNTPAVPRTAETPKAAPSQTVTGTIANMDVNTGMVTLTTADNQTRQFTVAKRLLEGLKVGDRVKVEMAGKDVQAIRKETRG